MSDAARNGPDRRVEWSVFLTLLFAYAFFWQGGGWNQNVRFDQVRAVVESRELAVDGFLLYRPAAGGAGSGEAVRLERHPAPRRPSPAFNSLDLARGGGRYYPNKPPGLSLLALPGYWVVLQVERRLGIDPDAWAALTFNAWATSVLSVAWLAALQGVLLLRLSRRLFPGAPPASHVATAFACGLATLVLPFATTFFDHVVTGTLLLAAFACLCAGEADGLAARRGALRIAAAGLLGGLAVMLHYTAALPVAVLVLYGAITGRRHASPARFALLFGAGAAPALLLLAAYHEAAFGSPLRTSSHQQLAVFQSQGEAWLGILGLPDPGVLLRLLLSPHRGLFFSSPVLLLACAGWWRAARKNGRRPEALACVGAFGVLLLLNASFNAWHGGNGFGPRYLVPGIPLLALGLTPSFAARPRATAAAAAISALLMLLATAVNPQVPAGVANPFTQHLVPLALGETVEQRGTAVEGRVSSNVQGVYESAGYRLFPRGSRQARWNSFNLGELLAPGSWWSIAPWLGVVLAGLGLSLRWAQRAAAAGRPA